MRQYCCKTGPQPLQLRPDGASRLCRANPLQVFQKHKPVWAGKKTVHLPKPSATLSAYPSSKLRRKNLDFFFFWLDSKNTADNVFGDLLNLIHSND